MPDGRVPIGATVAPDWPGFDPGARSRGGDPLVGLDVFVRLWAPTALSSTLLVGPAFCGLTLLWDWELDSGGAVGLVAEPGVPASPGGPRKLSKARGEWPRTLEGPLAPGTPGRMLPLSSM